MHSFTWLNAIRGAFAAPEKPSERALRDFSKFGIGFCPGCKRLRGVASSRCGDCGSAAPVTEDA